MFRASTVATIMATGLAVAACSTDHTPTAPDTGSVPSFRSEHSPPGPGTRVSHGSGGFFSTISSPGAPYFIAIGLSASGAAQLCSGGEEPEFGPLRSLFVERPNGGVHLLFKSDGKVPLLLYPAGTEDICSASPVAEGTGTFTDIASNLFGGPGRGTSGTRIRGTVTDLAGERHHVLVVIQTFLGPNGFVDRVRKISVN
jgi:hypothetical protein